MAEPVPVQAAEKPSRGAEPETDVFIPNPDALAARLLGYLEDDEDDMDDDDHHDEDGGMGGFGDSSSNQFPLMMSTISRYTDTSRILTVDLSAAFPAFNIPVGDTKKAFQGNVLRGDMSARAIESARRHEAQDAMIRDAHGGQMHVLDLGGRVGQEAVSQAAQPAAKKSESIDSHPVDAGASGDHEVELAASDSKAQALAVPGAVEKADSGIEIAATEAPKPDDHPTGTSLRDTVHSGVGSSQAATVGTASAVLTSEGFAASNDADAAAFNHPDMPSPSDSPESTIQHPPPAAAAIAAAAAAATATEPKPEADQLATTQDVTPTVADDGLPGLKCTQQGSKGLVHTGTSLLSSDSPRSSSNRGLAADDASDTQAAPSATEKRSSGTSPVTSVIKSRLEGEPGARARDVAATVTGTSSPGNHSSRTNLTAPLEGIRADPAPAATADATPTADPGSSSSGAETLATPPPQRKGFFARLLGMFGCSSSAAASSEGGRGGSRTAPASAAPKSHTSAAATATRGSGRSGGSAVAPGSGAVVVAAGSGGGSAVAPGGGAFGSGRVVVGGSSAARRVGHSTRVGSSDSGLIDDTEANRTRASGVH